MLRVLITGGAGFIGSHLADELLSHGYRVRALDNLTEQVHGNRKQRPGYLDPRVELLIGDVRNPQDVRRALADVDAVFHLAAAVGVGQSMYEIASYTAVNALGTAVLLEALAQQRVKHLVVASSMSIYGEGLYRTDSGELESAAGRTPEQLLAGQWEPLRGQQPLAPMATPETKAPTLSSVYALGKYDQEQMCLIVGRAYGIATSALRFFNVYGPRQALSNPYTGVLANFAARLLNDNAPLIFEDGLQRRDFVNVHDVARACRLALESPAAAGEVLNVGSGEARSIRSVALDMASALGRPIPPKLTSKYRSGDIRHCFADIGRAKAVIGYEPLVTFEAGLRELCSWLEKQSAVDRVAEARAELELRGLTL
jgi:dTDP-L-rhamnose 4-epimerase